MAENDTIAKEKVKYAGLGDFKEAYAFSHSWVKDEGFNITEDLYSEKIKGDSKDLEIKWTASKKITDYFKIKLEIKWRIIGMTDVEVEIDGKKKKMNKFIDLSIEVKGTLVKDWSSKWELKPIHKTLKDIYHKYVIPSRISEKEGEVQDIVQDFKEEMKSFFELTGKK